MIKLIDLLKEAESEAPKCPIATQNIEVNLAHRQIAIDRYGYGPLNPNNPNIRFWKDKMQKWNLDSIEEAKSARCNSCAAFNITSKILNCIEKGLAAGEIEVAPADVPIKSKSKPVTEGDETTTQPATEPELDDTQGAEKDAWDTIEAGKLGYCTMHKFKCAGSRTCNAWIEGGPVKDK
jgi:hypothetical protein